MASPEIRTKRHWLVLLPATARLSFRGGEALADSYESCLTTITRYQHLTATTPLAARFLSVRPGDMLWFALRNIGVVGRGVVETVHGRPEAEVRFAIDPDASRILVADPIPARHMGKVAVGLREGSPTALHDQPEAVEAFEWWWRELGELDERRLKVLDDTRPARQTRGWARRIGDEPVLAATSRTLRGAGLSVGTPARASKLDLIGIDNSRLIGMSMAPGPAKQTTDQALGALGYGMHHLRELHLSLDDTSMKRGYWIAFAAKPDADLLEFLEETGCGVIWLDRGAMQPGPLSAAMLTQLAYSPIHGAE